MLHHRYWAWMTVDTEKTILILVYFNYHYFFYLSRNKFKLNNNNSHFTIRLCYGLLGGNELESLLQRANRPRPTTSASFQTENWPCFEVKYIWSNPCLNCGCRWKWRMIIAFKQLERRSLKKSAGFEPVTSANTGTMLYQLRYEATHWERGQSIEFISPVRSEMMWSMYEIIHIWTAVVDESEEWSSQ